MEVGIVSFCSSRDNYGQILQCWALQETLRRLGHEPFHISYFPARPSKMRQFLDAGLVRSVVNRIVNHRQITLDKSLRAENARRNAVRDFEGFISANLRMSPLKYDSLAGLRDEVPQADAYIAGSDQVWSKLPVTDAERPYYLDFGGKHVRRIAYAASFGRSSYPHGQVSALSELLLNFDAVSVREHSGVAICGQAGRDDAVVTLDPTLLLNGADYQSLGFQQTEAGPYAFIYSVNVDSPDQMDWKRVKDFARRSGYGIKAVTASGHIPGRELFDDAGYLYPTIPEWIGLIKDASIVFTSSFHGVVFSLLMHRNFVFYPVHGRYSGGNGRVESLMKLLSLENHIWKEGLSYDELPQPDWELVDAALEEARKASLDFLKDNL
jgi:hypothetical protein